MSNSVCNRLVTGFVAMLLLSVKLSAQSPLLPLVQGNSWTLKSPYSAVPIELTVEWVEVVGSQQVASVRFNNPVLNYSFLLSSDESGVWMDGIGLNGVEQRFQHSGMLYPAVGTEGQEWQSEVGTVTLIRSNEVVRTRSGTYRDCKRFRVVAPDGSVQIWVLAPGVGFVAFGDVDWAFTLSTLTLNPDIRIPKEPVPANCPPLGLASIPSDVNLSLEQREGALLVAMSTGSRVLNINATWSELEPFPGSFRLKRIQDEIALAQKYGLKAFLTLGPVYSTVSTLPSDLKGLSWDDPLVVTRFQALLTAILPNLPEQVSWLNLGYEVDVYFHDHPEELAPFRQFLDQVKLTAQSLKPIPVGTVFSFDMFRAENSTFVALESFADHFTFDYYALGDHFQQRDPAVVDKDFWLMVHHSKGRPVILGEVGYSTAKTSGSDLEKQRQFFENVFRELRKYSGRIYAASVWALNDLNAPSLDKAVSLFEVDHPTFNGFMSSLGLRTSDGTPKPAWEIYTSAQLDFSSNSQSCWVID